MAGSTRFGRNHPPYSDTMTTNKLTCIADDLFCLDSSFAVWGCAGSLRMSVVRTPSGLVIYSPVALDANRIADIKALGHVRAIVAPNLYHHMFLRAAAVAFPDADIFVPSGLEDKIGPIQGAKTVADDGVPALPPELQHHTFTGHRIREISLFHTPSCTLITADLIYNYQSEHFAAEKLFFRLMRIYGRPGVPFYHRFAIEDKASVGQLINKVRSWPVRRIVPCHGRIIEGDSAGDVFVAAWKRFA